MRFKIDEEAMDALWADALCGLPRLSEAAEQAVAHIFCGLLREFPLDLVQSVTRAADGTDDTTVTIRLSADFRAAFARATEDWLVRHGGSRCGAVH